MIMTVILTIFAAQSLAVSEKNIPPSHEHSKEFVVKAEETHPVIQETLNDGHFLRLSDNSLWEINPKDTPISESWIFPVEIIASPSNDLNYPYFLTNAVTKSKVRARRISSMPKSQNAPTQQ